MATILIVDDDIGLREGLAETITDFGHKPRAVSSGREALGIVEHQSVDGILLDLRMPGGIDGIEVLRRIRVQQNPPPVVVLTAFASAENTIEAMRLGAFDHLTKPIGRQELQELLTRMLESMDVAAALASFARLGGQHNATAESKVFLQSLPASAQVPTLGSWG